MIIIPKPLDNTTYTVYNLYNVQKGDKGQVRGLSDGRGNTREGSYLLRLSLSQVSEDRG